MKLEILDLGRMAYSEAYRLQRELVQERIAQPVLCRDRLLLVEHEPIYTLGRHAEAANILLPQHERERLGIGLAQTDRGGQVTYHGPGQITGYPIIKLSQRQGRGVAWYVGMLEDVLIQTLARFSLQGGRDAINPGVWLGTEKIAALGVRVCRNVTMHGFALNVAVDLSHYGGIVPCGIQGRGVTSMHVHCRDVALDRVKAVLVDVFCEVMGYAEKMPVERLR